jgi:exonuclease SbcC
MILFGGKMKPVNLQIKNFGPFAETVDIDFEALGEFFLICGNTGSGKTTIFDAITYALYDKLCGTRSGSDYVAKNIRSAYCSAGDLTEVTFVFIVDNTKYRICRSQKIKYSRNKTENGVYKDVVFERNKTENDAAKLNFSDSDTDWIRYTGNRSELDKNIQKVIKLNSEQFSRIVLLPQGAFADFLHQNSENKQKLLEELFPVKIYSEIAEEAEKRYTEINALLVSKAAEEKQLLSQHNPLETEDQILKIKNNIKVYETERENIQKQIENKAKLIQEIEIKIEKVKKIINWKKTLNDLEGKKTEIDARRKKLKAAKDAEEIKYSIEVFEKSDTAHKTCIQKKDVNCKDLESVKEYYKTLCSNADTIKNKKILYDNLLILVAELNKASLKEKELKTCVLEKESINSHIADFDNKMEVFKTKITTLEDKLSLLPKESIDLNLLNKKVQAATSALHQAEDIVKTIGEIERLKQIVLQTLTKLENTKQNIQYLIKTENDLNDQIKNLETQQTAQDSTKIAIELAKQLKENHACPVCGSLNHPLPASKQNEQKDETNNLASTENCISEITQKLKEIQKKLEQEKINESRLNGTIEANNEQIESIKTKNSDKILVSLTEAKANINAAKKNEEDSLANYSNALNSQKQEDGFRKDLSTLNNAIHQLTIEKNAVDQKDAILKSKIDILEKEISNTLNKAKDSGITKENIAASLEKTNTVINSLQAEISAYEKNVEQSKEQITKFESTIQQLQIEEKTRKIELDAASEIFQANLTKSSFSNVEEAKMAIIPENEKADIQKTITDWENEITRLNTLLEENKIENYNQDELEGKLLESQNEKNDAENKVSDIHIAIQNFVEQRSSLSVWLEQYKKNHNELKELSEKYNVTNRLAEDLNGRNPRKTPIEIWILSIFVEEIVDSASNILNKISEGRFMMTLNNEKKGGRGHKGLDIEIFDTETASCRPAETLSGGETFMASISLALALSRIITERSGGVSLDSFFIDEGFGTLDTMTLNKSISILDELRCGKTIGIISHVEELRNQIPGRLEIIKTANGSKVIQI